jgi:hypothetical protein
MFRIHHIYKNILAAKTFFKTKENCKVIFFEVPSSILFSYLDYDIVKIVSHRIDQAAKLNLDTVDSELQKAEPLEFLRIRKIIKLAWLSVHLQNNKSKNPLHLIKSGNKYFCHPGTDRVIVLTYLRPTETVKGFYLWYPEIDLHPFVLDYKFKEIKNYFAFLLMFSYGNTFKLRTVQMSDDLDVDDKEHMDSNAMFLTAKNCFLKTIKKFNVPFISFHDNSQWIEIEKYKFKDLIKFEDENNCVFGGLHFVRSKGSWILND